MTGELLLFQEIELEIIKKYIQDNKIVVINGIGGIGKTSIARTFFSSAIANERQFKYLRWINCSNGLAAIASVVI